MTASSRIAPAAPAGRSAEERVAQFDRAAVAGDLNGYGCAVLT
jgi:hypothetical protein